MRCSLAAVIAALTLATVLAALPILMGAMTWCAAMEDEQQIADWGPETEGCRFAVTADREAYRFDRPIRLRLTLANVSERPVRVLRANLMDVYRFDLRLPDGQKAPLTLEGRRQADARERSLAPLRAGESHSRSVPMLNRLYDMSLLGEYTLTVYRYVWPPGDKARPVLVKSNTLKIVVHERESEESEKK